ncbi:alanine racemase, partial [Ruminococcus champanellensis]
MNEILKQCESAFYVFDLERARARIRFLRAHLPEGVALCYAVKANTFIIGGLLRDVERFEICSPGEAEICEKLGVPGNMMVISGVYKTPSVMEHLVASGGDRTYTVESLTQFALLRDLAKTYGRTLPVLLRLTNDSQFGINQEDIMDIIRDR